MLEQHFNDLKGTLKKLLDERLMSLLQEVDTIEQESIKPLDECQKLIEHGVSTADDLLRDGKGRPDPKSWLYLPVCLLWKTGMFVLRSAYLAHFGLLSNQMLRKG